NSTRAHKHLLSGDYFTRKFSEAEENGNYKNYSEAEFVRYSESLVLEYKKARGLEAKILRVGEMLGEGIELSRTSYVGRMVWEAVNKQDLSLDDDGLDSEYHVHLLDAVYGVLKAQFSKDLEHTIYTLSYPEPISQLSLGYKVQELEVEAGEIKFIDSDDSRTRLDMPIYKAAPNLQKIGWYPKVDFESALQQSLAYSKRVREALVAEQEMDESAPFSSEEMIEVAGANTALARLIAERKMLEQKRKEKIALGVVGVEEKKRIYTRGQKLRRAFLRSWDALKKEFSFLREITLFEAGVYTFLFAIFMFVFLTLLSPLVSIFRDFYLLREDIQSVQAAGEQGEWEQMISSSDSAADHILELEDTIMNSEILFALTQSEALQQDLLGLVQSYQFYNNGINSFAVGVRDSERFYELASQELVYRPTNNSLLSYNEIDDSQEIDASQVKSNFNTAERNFANSNRIYEQLGGDSLPSSLRDYTQELFNYSAELDQLLVYFHRSSSLMETMERGSYTLGIALQDNAIPNYNGGEVAAVGFFSVRDGQLSDIRLQPTSIVDLEVANLTTAEITDLEDATGRILQTNRSYEAKELLRYSLPNGTYERLLEKSIGNAYGIEIDEVFVLNSLAFAEILSAYPGVAVNDRELTETDYLAQIKAITEEDDVAREEILGNLLAITITRFANFSNEGLEEKIALMVGLSENEMVLTSENFSRAILPEGSELPNNGDIFLSAIADNSGNVETNQVINLGLEGELTATEVQYRANLSNLSSYSDVVFCLDSETINFEGEYDLTKFKQFNSGNYNCYNISLDSESTVALRFSSDINSLNHSLDIEIPPGFALRYDIEVEFPSGLSIESTSPAANSSNNVIFYSGEVITAFDFTLRFN
ncbi:MAG: hypothetical protein ACOCXP_01165, partial [Candidatus Dojkabacteria bacterium]